MKCFLDLISLLKLSGINVTTHSQLKDMEWKNIIKADQNNNTALEKKEATSSSSEALTVMVFLSSSDYNRFRSIIPDLKQDIQKW